MKNRPHLVAPYQATGFPKGLLPHIGRLEFSPDDLVHALFTTGRAPGNRMRHGNASVWELIHRTSLFPAYLRRTPLDRVARSTLALELDRSEKVSVSYALGQAMTSVFLQKLLSVRFLMHVDRYAFHYGIRLDSRKRPDLFGQQHNGDWIVAEAKGRSNATEQQLKQTLLTQKRSISSIRGNPPAIAVGCVASFPPRSGTLHLDAFDPSEDEPEAIALNLDFDQFILAYYEPFVAAIEAGEATLEAGETIAGQRHDEMFVFAEFPTAGFTVGLLRSIFYHVRRAEQGEVRGLAEVVMSELDYPGVAEGFPDGTIIEANWEEALATNDW